ncbi:MAG: sugar transporter permease [Caulobacteraceae bacterium]|nr:sugar transporter permease [Caulobacteraceae bacterium]
MADVLGRPSVMAKRPRRNRGWRNLLFVAPYLFLYLTLLVYPLFAGMGLSLFKADLFGVEQFLGLHNYARLATDPLFIGTFWNTVYFVILTVPALTALGLALALALNRPTRFAAILRGIFFASTVLSVTVVTLIWRIVYQPDTGMLSTLLKALGRPSVAVLDDVKLVMPAIALTTIWWCLGVPLMLFLAALQQVPKDLYEAAALDGAGPWTTLRRITLPAIGRTVALVVIIEIILQFQLFGQVQLMTAGGPNNASRSIVLAIYETGFRQWDLGYAAAASQVLLAVIAIAAMGQFALARRRGDA